MKGRNLEITLPARSPLLPMPVFPRMRSAASESSRDLGWAADGVDEDAVAGARRSSLPQTAKLIAFKPAQTASSRRCF